MVYTYDPLTVDPLPGGSIRPRSLKCSLVDSCLGHSAGNHGWFPCKSCLNMCYFFLQLFSSTIFKQFCRILACNMAESVVRSKSGSWDRWWLGSIEFGLRCFWEPLVSQMASGLFWKPSGSRMCLVSFSAGVVGRLAPNCLSLVMKVELESCKRNSWLLRVAHFKPGIPTLGHYWCCLILAQRCNPAIDHLSFK